MRVQKRPEDIGRCGCGRRIYCDGSHGLTEEQWQAKLAEELAAVQFDAAPSENTPVENTSKRKTDL